MILRSEPDFAAPAEFDSTLRSHEVARGTLAPALEPVAVVAKHQHEVVAQGRTQQVGDGTAAREFDFHLGAAEVFGAVGSQD